MDSTWSKRMFVLALLAKLGHQKGLTGCKTSAAEAGRFVKAHDWMARIVTSNNSPSPIIQPSTVTPNAPSTKSAEAKCEEYRHRVKKRSSIVTYVFGGTEALSREFPHMAILGYGQPNNVEWLCGGSLISEQFVVTAAHCLINSNLGQLIRVRLGDLDLTTNQDDADPRDFAIAQKHVHPSYKQPEQYNDIALLKLDARVEFSDYIAPICLETGRSLQNYNFIASGWGRTELGGSQSDSLMKVDLDYFANAECRRTYQDVAAALPRGIVDDIQICAGSHRADKDTCQGDSGGPLQIRSDGGLLLVGITSFGKVCGAPNTPGVYTRVSSYVPWIEGIVWSR